MPRPIDAEAFEQDLHKLIDISIQKGDVTMNAMLSLMLILLRQRPTIKEEEHDAEVH